MNRSGCVCDLLFSARTKKNHAAVSKHLGVLPDITRGCNNVWVWVKTAPSAAIIVCFLGVYVNFDGL